MNFNKCKISGQLVAQGDKGQYWIEELAWFYLTQVYVDNSGPFISELGGYRSLEEAKQAAEDYDKAEE